MARTTNYKRERVNRAQAKAAKREAKRQAKAAKAASRNAVKRDRPNDAEAQRQGVNDDDAGAEIET